MPINTDLAPMRVDEVHPERALRPAPSADGASWRRALMRAGLLAPISVAGAGDDPRALIVGLQRALFALESAEAAIESARTVEHKVRLGDAPLWAWGLLAAQPLVWMQLTTWMRATGDEVLWLGLWVYVLPGAAAAVVVAYVWGQAAARRRARDAEIDAARTASSAALVSLERGLRRLRGRVFVATAEGRVLLCADPLIEAAHLLAARQLAMPEALDARRFEGEGAGAEAVASADALARWADRLRADEDRVQRALLEGPSGGLLELEGPWGPPG